ncbi:hypothetical protein N9A70_05095 [Akkermansiaceae bacterium]|nr:hypothetical protein [Akkermansiaceae bacterium]
MSILVNADTKEILSFFPRANKGMPQFEPRLAISPLLQATFNEEKFFKPGNQYEFDLFIPIIVYEPGWQGHQIDSSSSRHRPYEQLPIQPAQNSILLSLIDQ